MTAFGTALMVSGSEQLLSMRAVDERKAQALAEQPDADVNRLDAVELQDSILAEVVGASLFSSHCIAIIDDVGGTPADVVDQLVATAADPGEELCLILVHEGGNKGRGLVDKLKKAKIEVAMATPLKPWEVWKFCQSEARRHRVQLSREAAESLVAAVGTDLRALTSAVSQLVDDLDGQQIDPHQIQRYFAGRAEVSAFAVCDAVLAGDFPVAMERLRWALNTGVAPVLITSAMANAFRGMGKYLEARNSRMNSYDLARHVGIPAWKIKDYSRNSRHWQISHVANAMQFIARADADVKGAANDPGFALEQMLLAVLERRPAAVS